MYWIIGIVALFIIALYFFVQFSNHDIIISRYTYTNAKIPESFRGYKILQLSDMHGDFPKWKAEILVRKVYEVRPDIIVLTGDVIDHIHFKNYDRMIEVIENLRKDFRIFYVTGNHEYMHKECNDIILDIEQRGITVLHGRGEILWRENEKIYLYGIDDPYALYCGNVPSEYTTPVDGFKNALTQLTIQPPEFNILLSHRPEFFIDYVDLGFDIVFSGHAHGGQWRFPLIKGVIAPDQGLFPKYTSGRYSDGATTMYVSRGLGNSVVPIRLFNRPEIVLLEFC